MSTSVASVTSHFPTAENGFSTTTAGSVTSGASTVSLNATTGYEDGEVVVFVIDPTDATKKQTFTGVMDTDTNQVTGVVWTAGVNQGHDAGATVVDYATATHIAMITKGILVSHNQDGTLKANTVDTDQLRDDAVTADKILDGAVTTDKLNADSVTASKLADDAVFPANLTAGQSGSTWVWQSYVPTWTAFTVGNGTVTAAYVQIGKTVHARIHVDCGSTTDFGTTARFSLPVAASSAYSGFRFHPIGQWVGHDSGARTLPGFVITDASTTTATMLYWATNAAAAGETPIYDATTTVSAPFDITSGDDISITLTYESA